MSRLSIYFVFLALALLGCALSVQAATETPAPVVAFGVTLTAAQAEQFKAFNVAAEPAKILIRENENLSETDKRTQMTAIYDNIKLQLRAILTPEQLAKMDKLPTPEAVVAFGVKLTAAQADQFKAFSTAADPAKKLIRENAKLSEAEKNAQMTAIYDNIKLRLRAILTPEQLAIMDKPPTPESVVAFGVKLTAAQAEKYKTFIAAAGPAEKAIIANAKLSEAEKRTQKMAIYDNIKLQLRAILTTEQLAKMDKLPTPEPVVAFGVKLTAAQAEQLKAFSIAAEPAKKLIRENATLSEADKRTQMMAIYDNIKLQLRAILTPKQLAIMDKPAPTAEH